MGCKGRLKKEYGAFDEMQKHNQHQMKIWNKKVFFLQT